MFDNALINTVLHIAVAIAFPPFLLGVINRVKAVMGGRQGKPLLQTYRDLRKLMRKESVFSETTTWVFRMGPVIVLAAVLMAAMTVPLGQPMAPLAFAGDLVFLTYVLGLSRFFTMMAALDTGSAFEGMGAAREATYACLAEPTVFLGLVVLARITGQTSMSGLLGNGLHASGGAATAPLILVLVSWFVVLLVENSRIPFDDPNTHLELTMIHEVMILDHSGPALGMILYAAAIKLFVFSALIVRLAIPIDTGVVLLDWLVFLVGTIAVAALIGVVESTMARLRLPSIPSLLAGAGVLSLLGFILVLVQQ